MQYAKERHFNPVLHFSLSHFCKLMPLLFLQRKAALG